MMYLFSSYDSPPAAGSNWFWGRNDYDIAIEANQSSVHVQHYCYSNDYLAHKIEISLFEVQRGTMVNFSSRLVER